MSTNSECLVVEVAPGEWFYVLQDYDAPRNAFDWRDFATAYGLFGNEDEATGHLGENHPNPGGYNVKEYRDGYEPDETMSKLIAAARLQSADTRGY